VPQSFFTPVALSLEYRTPEAAAKHTIPQKNFAVNSSQSRAEYGSGSEQKTDRHGGLRIEAKRRKHSRESPYPGAIPR
jgi:hypothetical protein